MSAGWLNGLTKSVGRAWLAAVLVSAIGGNAFATVASPDAINGATLFGTNGVTSCSGCHKAGVLEAQPRNGANSYNYLNTGHSISGFSIDQLADIAAYLGRGYLGVTVGDSPSSGAVAYNATGVGSTAFTLANLYMNSSSSSSPSYPGITTVTTASGPSKGVVSYTVSGNVATANYTPNAGATGADSWTYYATGTNPSATSTRTATVFIAGATTTALTSSVNPTQHGNSTTFTATVSGASPTGTVTFKDGAATLSTVSLTGSTATLSVSNLSLGGHSITAVYNGNINNATSTSGTVTQTVNKRTSSTALVSGTNPTVFGGATALTATVTGSSPSGNIVFKDAGVTIGTVALTNSNVTTSAASLSVSNLSVGTHSTITAEYAGDTNNNASNSSNVSQVVTQVSSSTALTSGTNPTTFNLATVFTATVSGSSPSGSVVFKDGATTLGTVALTNTNPTTSAASLSVANLTVGTHNNVTAQYLGDTNNAASTSSPFTQTVNVAPTSTALVTLSTPTAFSSPATFNATVTGIAPTGTVTFMDGATSIGSATLNGSFVATLTVSNLSVAVHNITAVYGGDGNNGTSTSSPVVQTVNTATSATTLASSTNPSTFGASITLTATIAGPTPTGTVTFKDGTNTIGTATVSSGAASLTLSSLSAGSHSLTALYSGDVNNAPSTSATLTQTVNAVVSGTVLTSNANPSAFGAATLLTATVTGSAPSGTITFKDGGSTIGSGTLTGGVATLSVSNFTVGAHSLTAVYSGDTNNAASTSSALAQTVTSAATVTSIASSVNPTVLGGTTVLSSTVSGVSPSGTVTFKDGTTTLGTVTLSAGSASLSVAALTVGSHTLTAVYSGDTNNAASTSSTLAQIVSPVTSSVALTSSVSPSIFSSSIRLTATVTGSSPSGTVTFVDGATTIGSATITGGVAVFPISNLAVGPHALTAVYSGDTNNSQSTSSAVAQQVLPAPSSVALTSSDNPSIIGGATMLTATVSGVSPTGSVTFLDGTTVIGTATLSAGVGTLSISSLTVGAHSVTVSYSGDDNNVPGVSALLTQTVNPAGLPTITSHTTGSNFAFSLNVASNIQLLASNFASSFSVSPAMPAGFSLNTTTGLISVSAVAPMASTAYTFTASNLLGTGTATVLNLSVGAPAPSACNISTPLNTAQTIDLAMCAFPGLTPTGFNLSAAPGHGSALVSGTTLTYTPATDYFGADSLSVIALFGRLRTSAATVTITVTGRPDPAADPEVIATLAAQQATATLFTKAQISNVMGRMENLRGRTGGLGPRAQAGGGNTGQTSNPLNMVANAANGFGAQAQAPSLAERGGAYAPGARPDAVAQSLSNQYATLIGRDGVPVTDPQAGPQATTAANVVMALQAALGQSDSAAVRAAGQVIGLVQGFSQGSGTVQLNMSSDSGKTPRLGVSASADTGADSGLEYWMSGGIQFSKKAIGSGIAFSTSGLSVGADKRLSDNLVAGIGLGFGRESTDIGTDGSRNEALGNTLMVYGSYLATQQIYVDALLGYGRYAFDSKRWVSPIDTFASSERTGRALFASLAAGYEWRVPGLTAAPYLRVDVSDMRMQATTEAGAGLYNLFYAEDGKRSRQLSVGLRGQLAHALSSAWVMPRARLELQHNFDGAQITRMAYADQPTNLFSVSSNELNRNSVVLGLGTDFLFRSGLRFSVDYQLQYAGRDQSSQGVFFLLKKTLDGRGPDTRHLEDFELAPWLDGINLDTGVMYDDNVTRSSAKADVLSDTAYQANFSRSWKGGEYVNSRHAVTLNWGGERWANYHGLDRLYVDLDAQWQYRASGEFGTPIWSVLGKGVYENFGSDLRDGTRLSVGGSVWLPLTDRTQFTGTLMRETRNAKSSVFDARNTVFKFGMDYNMLSSNVAYFGAEWRQGDQVSSGRPSLASLGVARMFVADDAFAGGPYSAYRFKGRSALYTLGLYVPLGGRDAIDFSWRLIDVSPNVAPISGPIRYRVNQLSIVYQQNF